MATQQEIQNALGQLGQPANQDMIVRVFRALEKALPSFQPKPGEGSRVGGGAATVGPGGRSDGSGGGGAWTETTAEGMGLLEGRLIDLDAAVQQVGDAVGKTTESIKKNANDMVALNAELVRTSSKEWFEAQRGQWREFSDSMKRASHAEQLLGPSSGVGALTGRQGLGGLGQGGLIGNLQGQLFGGMPMGGWLGLMLQGANDRLKFNAMGQEMSQAARGVGQVTDEMAHDLGDKVRKASGMGTELKASYDAALTSMSEHGVTFAETLITKSVKIGDTLYTVADAAKELDASFGLAMGTAVKEAAKFVAATGQGPDSAVGVIKDLGIVSRTSGVQMQTLMSSFTGSTQALRMQIDDARVLESVYMKLRSAGMEAFSGRGARFAGNYAAEAMPRIAGKIAGMDEGLMAYLGTSIIEGNPSLKKHLGLSGDVSGVEALYAMKTGMTNIRTGATAPGGYSHADAVLTALAKPLADFADMPSKLRFLEKVGGFETPDAMMIARYADQLKNGVKLDDSAVKELDGAFDRLKNTKDPITLAIEDVKTIMSRIGELMFGTVSNILRTTGLIFQAIAHPSSILNGDLDAAFSSIQREQSNLIQRSLSSVENSTDAVKQLFRGLALDQPWSMNGMIEREQAWKQRNPTSLKETDPLGLGNIAFGAGAVAGGVFGSSVGPAGTVGGAVVGGKLSRMLYDEIQKAFLEATTDDEWYATVNVKRNKTAIPPEK